MARIGETSFTARLTARSSLVGHEIAAVGAGADGEGLLLEAAQGGVLAVAHVGLEGGLVLEGGAGAQRGAGEVRPGRLQGELVDDALVLVERAVDAVDLVGGDDVGGHAALDLAEALVVGVLEGLEGAHEVVEGGGEVAAGGGFGFEWSVFRHGSPLLGEW